MPVFLFLFSAHLVRATKGGRLSPFSQQLTGSGSPLEGVAVHVAGAVAHPLSMAALASPWLSVLASELEGGLSPSRQKMSCVSGPVSQKVESSFLLFSTLDLQTPVSSGPQLMTHFCCQSTCGPFLID